MSSQHNHEEMVGLLAPYAINAVDPEEREAVEAFLRAHPEYQSEVDEYRDAGALLAAGHRDAPSDVWERIQSTIEPSAPPLRLIDEQRSAARQTRRYKRVSGLVSVAAVTLAVTLGAVLVTEPSEPAPVSEFAAASQSSGARTVNLMSTDEAHSASVVVTADGHGFVENANLPELPADKTYQLWAFTDQGAPISVAVLGRTVPASAFMAVAHVSTLAITVEDAGGVVSPSSLPVVSAALPA